MNSSEDDKKTRSIETRLVRTGRDPELTGPFVNPPVVHASTVLFPDTETMLGRRQRYLYGRRGTPTSEALESAVNDIEGAAGSVLCPSGLNAVSTALLSALSAGDEVLIVDCVYQPVRHFADTVLKRMNINTVYFDPAIGGGIADLFTERTRAVYLEAPGSLTFEMQDVPAIAAIAHERGATVLFDNTWATAVFFRPLEAGADLSIQAGTKYVGGHSDVNLGYVAANKRHWPALKETYGTMGLAVGPDDLYLGLRGLRTMAVRLERHMRSALQVATWLEQRSEIARVLYPALPGHPGHALWKRDMAGASGLFAIIFDGWDLADTKTFVDGLELFGIGASWGGFESLAIYSDPSRYRSATPWNAEGPLVRLHIGLEDPDDLIADLEAGFARVEAGK